MTLVSSARGVDTSAQAAQVRRGHLNQITEATIAFLRNLSPEQRAKFVKIAHQGSAPWALQFERRRD